MDFIRDSGQPFYMGSNYCITRMAGGGACEECESYACCKMVYEMLAALHTIRNELDGGNCK